MSPTVRVVTARRLVDGTGRPPLDWPVLLIRDGRLEAVGDTDDMPIPPDAERHDFPDATIVPGLVDAHVHLNLPGDGTPPEATMEASDALLLLRSADNAARDLASGVTTLQDLGSRNRTALDLRDAIEAGLIAGPRVRAAGRPLTLTGGHMWYMRG